MRAGQGWRWTIVAAGFALLPATTHVAGAEAVRADGAVRSADAVSALGRIEPRHGIVRLGVSSTPDASSYSIVKKLLVEAGDDVTEGQLLAETDTAELARASIAVSRAELVLAQDQSAMASGQEQDICSRSDVAKRTSIRRANLLRRGAASNEEADVAAGDAKALSGSCASAQVATRAAASAVEVARARLARNEIALDRSYVRAPIAGRVLHVLARPGELIDTDGVLELADVSSMYAIAEVYETDINRVRKGQKATVTSSALGAPLSGVVDVVRLKVRKEDTTGTDPAARKDARVVEVEVLLDHPEPVATLTNLQVEVLIHP